MTLTSAAALAPTSTTATTIVRKLPETLIRWAGVSTAVRSLTAAMPARRAINGRSQVADGPRTMPSATAPASATAWIAIAAVVGLPVNALFMSIARSPRRLGPALVPSLRGTAVAVLGRGWLSHRLDEPVEVVASVAALAPRR